MDSTTTIGFICQGCCLPITLEKGFSNLDEITRAELTLPVFHGESVEIGQSAEFDRIVAPIDADDCNCTLGFSVIDDMADNQISPPLQVFSTLVDIISTNSKVDHPLCEECTNTLIEITCKDLKGLEIELRLYKDFTIQLKNTPATNTSALEAELKNLEEENNRLIDELNKVDEECKEATIKIEHAKQENLKLEIEEDKYWKTYCTYKMKLIARELENQSYKNQLSAMQSELEGLKQKNIFNTAFPIWANKHLGWINNLRLGRLPTVPVEWNEINAAWGQTVLLLWSLCHKLGIQFTKYKLVPFGNNSYVEEIKSGKILPLYGSSGLKEFFAHKFDDAMVAFLECMVEFQHYVEFKDPQTKKTNFRLPYTISGHRIFDKIHEESYSVKIQLNNEENWSKALKYILINLKWALACISTSSSESH